MKVSGAAGTRVGGPKRYLWMLGFVAPACALLPSQLVYRTGVELFWWIGPIIVFLVIPVLDRLVGDDSSDLSADEYAAVAEGRFYRWCLYSFLPVQFASLVVASYLWAGDELSTMAELGLAVTVGFVSGIGANVAHELGHRVRRLERVLAMAALAQSGYGHFPVEHNRGHHVWVATPRDPASSRLGESLWEFLPRCVFGGFRSALRLERERLRRKGKSWWCVDNQILSAWAATAVLFGALMLAFGPGVLPWLVVQAVVGIVLLEAVNYVEHYGLLREQLPDGRYRRCTPRDSWNSDRILTNAFLFNLQRHSDHHMYPGRRYHTLRSAAGAPQLPAGYITMLMLAAIAPWWRAVMDKRVLDHYSGDVTLANLHPRKRDSLLAKYGAVHPDDVGREVVRHGPVVNRPGIARYSID
ncbi:alkane 1-monooxygenase [Nocardia cyriacigeorgica]|uniref:alkane 1-monooxygenase n=1 Tax=Nocardia cyriacigeorgica TaxID=135487 RepID=UPI002453F27B|nr:alkane 1-monooxygenase [Nocardia cyriacigeorgica]